MSLQKISLHVKINIFKNRGVPFFILVRVYRMRDSMPALSIEITKLHVRHSRLPEAEWC